MCVCVWRGGVCVCVCVCVCVRGACVCVCVCEYLTHTFHTQFACSKQNLRERKNEGLSVYSRSEAHMGSILVRLF